MLALFPTNGTAQLTLQAANKACLESIFLAGVTTHCWQAMIHGNYAQAAVHVLHVRCAVDTGSQVAQGAAHIGGAAQVPASRIPCIPAAPLQLVP